MAIETKSVHNVDISKQGIDQRFNKSAIEYIQSLISKALSTQISKMIEIGWLSCFSKVNILDSSKFDLPAILSRFFPGFGGTASKAGACIQYDFELKAGVVNDLTLTQAKSSDSKYALDRMYSVKKGDLTVRDLGYFVLKYFKVAEAAGAFFLSKLNSKITVFEAKEDVLKELDFERLYKTMKRNRVNKLDMKVYIGTNEKFPVRLVAELMSDEVLNARIMKVNKYNKKKGYKTSKQFRDRARFNLFITNIPFDKINGEAIAKIYKVRWQIELVFKIWKSIFGLDNINPMKYERLMCILNARLLLVLINWETFMIQRGRLFEKTGKLLSILKCFKTLKENSWWLRNILIGGIRDLGKWLIWVGNIFDSKHWLEKKKNKLGLEEILYLNIL